MDYLKFNSLNSFKANIKNNDNIETIKIVDKRQVIQLNVLHVNLMLRGLVQYCSVHGYSTSTLCFHIHLMNFNLP